MTIDFDTQTLELSKGKTWNQGMNRAPDATFSFRWREGVPVMRMTAGEESLCFGLDTGAEINLLSVQKGKKIQEHLTLNQSRRIAGLKNRIQVLPAGQIRNLQIGAYLCPKMKVALASMGRYNSGADGQTVDGIVGYEFLQNLKVTIHFRKRTIFAWNRDTLSEPFFVTR
jgi:hypothetical protein